MYILSKHFTYFNIYSIYILNVYTIHIQKLESARKVEHVETYQISKPAHEIKPERFIELLLSGTDLSKYVAATTSPEYLYWDKVKYKPRPKGVTAEEFWALIKNMRDISLTRVKTPIRDEKGRHFTWQPLPGMDYFLHEVDMQLGGAMASAIVEGDSARNRFISRGIMEEAIASSQLEGANTTRKAAKRMILESRKPLNRSEQMILNNYRAMLAIEDSLRNHDLNIDLLFNLHTTLTEKTIDDADIGRFREDKDNIVVCDSSTGIVYHIPPKEQFLKSEIKKFIKYANDDSEKHAFVHPLIKAIILHFWIGFLHPFTDGNGRLARTIFYWYLLRNDYWAFSYLPVSRVIKSSPIQYRDAYIYSEQDDNDLTYFIDYNIRKIHQAKSDFESYLKRKEVENKKMTLIAQQKYNLNDRQIQLLKYLHKNVGATTTIKTHSLISSISRLTARKDLEQLETLGFIISKKSGRERPFKATEKTSELLS